MIDKMQLPLQLEPQSQIDSIHNLTIHIVWAIDNPQFDEALIHFWLNNKAIPTRAEALERTRQVVCVALDEYQQIAGVTTAFTALFGRGLEPYYFFRTFIRPDARKLGLAMRFVTFTKLHLAKVSTDMTPKPKGMIIVTDNLRLKLQRIHRWLTIQGYVLVGLTQHKKEIWKVDF